jgi:hypothetical protein
MALEASAAVGNSSFSTMLLEAVKKGLGEVSQCLTGGCGGIRIGSAEQNANGARTGDRSTSTGTSARSITWMRRAGGAGAGCVATNATGGGYKASIANGLLMVVAARMHGSPSSYSSCWCARAACWAVKGVATACQP